MDRIPPDPTTDRPDPDLAAVAADRLDRLRAALAEPAPLARLGLAVLDQLDLRPTDLRPGDSVAAAAGRFLAVVLPDSPELAHLGVAALTEYAAIDPDRPDPGRLAAGYGAARLRRFGGDRRLAYRSGGYRGRAGALLADHLIAAVLAGEGPP